MRKIMNGRNLMNGNEEKREREKEDRQGRRIMNARDAVISQENDKLRQHSKEGIEIEEKQE